MQFEVSDLLFPGFTKDVMKRLDKQYGIEFFYEFGKDYYWNSRLRNGVNVHFRFMLLCCAESC